MAESRDEGAGRGGFFGRLEPTREASKGKAFFKAYHTCHQCSRNFNSASPLSSCWNFKRSTDICCQKEMSTSEGEVFTCLNILWP